MLAGTLAWGAAAGAQVGSVGLSPIGGQTFDHLDLGAFRAQGGDQFGAALASGDFDGDGADDLATGIPFHDGIVGSEIPDIGAVMVRYGSLGQGLRTGPVGAFLTQLSADSPDPADEDDQFGFALAACDFNGDGFDDLAVGIPFEDHLGEPNAGAVQIHYGSSASLEFVEGDAFYAQSTPGIPGDVEADDNFGAALACGDFNGDGFDDLAIGVPQEDVNGEIGAGMIDVIPGSAGGLAPGSATSLDQDSAGMDGGAEAVESFGNALAVGDFNGDGKADLAIGVPREDFDDLNFNGAVHVVFGSGSGLTATGNRLFGETSAGGLAETDDRFGSSLAAGDFDRDGKDDLAIGIPFEDPDGETGTDSGRVAVVYGAAAGIDLGRTTFWLPEANVSLGHFGAAVAAADFDADGLRDLVVGHPGDVDGGALNNGSISVFMGATNGPTAARHRRIQPGRDAFPGQPANSERNFGQALAAGDFDGDSHQDLAIGAPLENLGAPDVGQEIVLYGSLHSDGFESGALVPAWLKFQEPGSFVAPGFGGFAGSHSALVHVDATHPAHLRHEIPAGTKSYRARFYARLWPLTIQPNRFFVLLEGRGGGNIQFTLYVNRGIKENGISVGVRDNSGTEVFAPLLIPVPDGWRGIEVSWRAATPGQSNGHFHLLIDGHFYDLLSGLNNSNSAIDLVRWGAVDRLDAGTHGAFVLDEYEAKRFTGLGQISALADTPLEDPNWPLFQGLFNAEVTFGCDVSRNYCPDLVVTREQMAVFLLRAKEGPTYFPSSCESAPYDDVSATDEFCPWIRELANREVMTGCGGGNFCPQDPVNRQQMAVLLQRTIEGEGNFPPGCPDNPFADIDRDDEFCPYIRYLADNGITAGCGGGMFCPFGPVTRAQMAPLLIEAFDLFVPEL
jgi:hypothetical protein